MTHVVVVQNIDPILKFVKCRYTNKLGEIFFATTN